MIVNLAIFFLPALALGATNSVPALPVQSHQLVEQQIISLYQNNHRLPPTNHPYLNTLAGEIAKLASLDPKKIMHIAWQAELKEAGYFTYRSVAKPSIWQKNLRQLYNKILKTQPFNQYGYARSAGKLLFIFLHKLVIKDNIPFTTIPGTNQELTLQLAATNNHKYTVFIMDPLGQTAKFPIPGYQHAFTYLFRHEGLYWFELIAMQNKQQVVNQLFPIQSVSKKPGFSNDLWEMVPPTFKKHLARVKQNANSAKEILTLFNAIRGERQMPLLQTNAVLQQFARTHAQTLSISFEVKHNTTIKNKLAPHLKKQNLTFKTVGEVIAYGVDVKSALRDLLRSPSHVQTILNPKFTLTGIALNPFVNPVTNQKFIILVINFMG